MVEADGEMTPPPPRTLIARAEPYWGWFWESGRRHEVDPLLLAAICDAESECGLSPLLDRLGPEGRGDGLHGHGLMQIDDRSHRSFLATKDEYGAPAWALPWANIEYATAYVVVPAMRSFPHNLPAAVAAYNAGVGRVKKAFEDLTTPLTPARKLQAANACTFKQNYVSRVLIRYRAFGGSVDGLPVELGKGDDSHGAD